MKNTPSALEVFDFEENPVRFFTREDGVVCAIAADIGRNLNIAHIRTSTANYPEDEKGVQTLVTLGGKQDMAYLTEPGIYRAIFRSNKPEAERFRRWVFHEVLPAIRKTGEYSLPDAPLESASLPDQPSGLDALRTPVTMPEFLANLLTVRPMPLVEIIRFGDRVRRLARSFGVPFVLKPHRSFGMLRAYPSQLCDYVLAATPVPGDASDEADVEELVAKMDAGTKYTLEDLIEISLDEDLFSNWLTFSNSDETGPHIKLGKLLQRSTSKDFGSVRLEITGGKNARKYHTENVR